MSEVLLQVHANRFANLDQDLVADVAKLLLESQGGPSVVVPHLERLIERAIESHSDPDCAA